jgi:Gpi18-like mannosyltransferase
MDSWIGWGEQMMRVGPGNFYTSGIWSDYTPGYLYFLWLISSVQHLFFGTASRPTIEFLYKSVPILFDLASGFMVYLILKRVTNRHADTSLDWIAPLFSLLYLLSPFTFFNSASWGQADSVPTFFALLSVYMLMTKRFDVSTIAFVVAVVIKPQSVALVPVYLVYYVVQRNWRRIVRETLVGLASFYVLTFPFWGLTGIQSMYTLLQSSLTVYPYNSLNAFNLWGIFGFWVKDTEPFFLGLTMQTLGTLLYSVSILLIIVYGFFVIKKNESITQERNVFMLCTFSIFSFVMFMTRMHERYLFPLFGFFIVFCGIQLFYVLRRGSPRLLYFTFVPLILFYLVSMLLHSIDLYYVYITYLYFNVGVPADNLFYYFISRHLVAFSGIMTALYILYIILMLSVAKPRVSDE